jgi:hypothetical protein
MTEETTIKSGDGSWEFPLIPEGDHLMTFQEVESLAREDGKAAWRFALKNEAGGQVSIFCPVETDFGLRKVADIIQFSGLADILSKQYKLPPLKDGWSKKAFGSQKMLQALADKLPGKAIIATVKHQEYKGKMNANVVAIRAAGKKVEKPAETDDDFEGF